MRKERNSEKKTVNVALAGNPNVGKSTLFNSLTGMRVHTGNWAGKTVGCESSIREFENYSLQIVDIPGTYSLFSHSEEERIARNYICFGGSDVTVIVCDATALEQNLNLALQIVETGRAAVLCLNFMDEAKKRGIEIDTAALSKILGIPVIPTVAHKRKTLDRLISDVCRISECEKREPLFLTYEPEIEKAASIICEKLINIGIDSPLARWLSLRLIDADGEFLEEISCLIDGKERAEILLCRERALEELFKRGMGVQEVSDCIVHSLVSSASEIASKVTIKEKHSKNQERIDRLLTGRFTAYPIMLAFLFLVLWITLYAANYPSMLLSDLFSLLEMRLVSFFEWINAPIWVSGALLNGVFRTLGQVVSVMLPPMVIFFPMFALLEDSGYLPRIAYNLDRPFACSGACGKQALTMCMGLGCNAVGIVGARIIDSKRERNLAIVTNSLMPCNGRLPMIITFITLICLFVSEKAPSFLVALILLGFIVLSVCMTFFATALLSKTLFKGAPSPFTIELPPYRRPRFFSVILLSLKDKCFSVLMRAIAVAAPMGLVIWVLANVSVGEVSVICAVSDFLDPLGKIMGLDGVILLAFILGLPANEIVIPLMLMIYSAQGEIGGELGIEAISNLLIGEGWTWITAISAAVFALFHSPCSTSLITVYKETKSKGMTLISFLLPLAIGFCLCVIINLFAALMGL